MPAWRTTLLMAAVTFVTVAAYGAAYQQSLTVLEIEVTGCFDGTKSISRAPIYGVVSPIPVEITDVMEYFFFPAHFVDRSIRPEFWSPSQSMGVSLPAEFANE